MQPPKDDVEISSDGVVYDGPIGGLQALLSSKAIISEAITVEHGGESKTVKFRELSNDQKQACLAFAIQYVEDRRRTQEEDGKGEWRDAESDRDVLVSEERDMRMLQASMLDPATNGPACSLTWLRKRMGTQLQTMLGERYHQFEALIDPQKVDEDMIKMVIDDVKKNTPIDLLLMQYGLILLVRSLQFSVLHQSTYEIGKSSGIGTGGAKPSKPRRKRK